MAGMGLSRHECGSGRARLAAKLQVVGGIRADSKTQAEQVRSVAVERLGPALSRLPASFMANLDEALRLHLQL